MIIKLSLSLSLSVHRSAEKYWMQLAVSCNTFSARKVLCAWKWFINNNDDNWTKLLANKMGRMQEWHNETFITIQFDNESMRSKLFHSVRLSNSRWGSGSSESLNYLNRIQCQWIKIKQNISLSIFISILNRLSLLTICLLFNVCLMDGSNWWQLKNSALKNSQLISIQDVCPALLIDISNARWIVLFI